MNPQATQLLAAFANPVSLALLIVLSLWSLAWKGMALWKAAQNSQRNWFIAMLIINSAGILEIIYIFYCQKKQKNTTA